MLHVSASLNSLFYWSGVGIWSILALASAIFIILSITALMGIFWDWSRKNVTIPYQLWEAQRIYYLYILRNDVGIYNPQAILDVMASLKRDKPRMKLVRDLYARGIRKVRNLDRNSGRYPSGGME